MKKFLLKVSVFAAYVFLLQVVVPIWVDPFNVFHTGHIRANGVDPNKNYIKMCYILRNPGKFNSFMFGSSRIGVIHTEKIAHERCYNMTYPNGVPRWHLLNVKTFLENSVYPQKIYIALDPISYTADYERQINDPMRCPYEYLANDTIHFMKLYLDLAMVLRSLSTMSDGILGKVALIDKDMFYKYGWGIPTRNDFDWSSISTHSSRHKTVSSSKHEGINLALKFIRDIFDVCQENNIELILFTNPMHRMTYLSSIENESYFMFLEGLAEISDFWNFSSLSDITVDNANYYEPSHYRANVGDLIIDIMCNGKSYPELQRQGFGVKVSSENARDFISMLRRQYQDYTE